MRQASFCPNCFAEGFADHCGHCGYRSLSQPAQSMALPVGTLLHRRYRIGRVLGSGGFGITYLVQDQQTRHLYAVKEYLPLSLAVRERATLMVRPSSAETRESFLYGLQVFAREAQVLRTFLGNPSIVQVYETFEGYGTAYFSMEYLDGVNVKALMRAMGGKVTIDQGLEVLQRIAEILQGIHDHGLLHRDVSPENIFITRKGEIKLIDFGATRFFLGERSHSLSVILKPGFAPPEQYSTRGRQGPWTDLYALCATFYFIVTGVMPPTAPDRLAGTPLFTLVQRMPQLPRAFADTVESGLSLDYRMRPQSMTAFLAALSAAVHPERNEPAPAVPPASANLQGTPYVQMLRKGRAEDKWILPKNMTMTIGRGKEQCNIIFDAPDISRVHCTLQYEDRTNAFLLTDLSVNGTWTREGRIPKGQMRSLQPGELFFLVSEENAMKVGVE